MSLKKAVINLFAIIGIFLSFQLNAQDRGQALARHVEKCLQNTDENLSKLNQEVLSIHGYSSPKVRYLLNNLCSLENAVYLEVGCWKGSTLVAALYGNQMTMQKAFAIENWSEFESPRDEFFSNIHKFLPSSSLQFIEADCFSINPKISITSPVNIYFYDGRHEIIDQLQAFTYFDNIFEDTFIAIVDDWNWENVRIGTLAAFKQLNYQILFEKQLFTNANGDMNSWWNGLYVAVIKKTH